MLDEGVGCIEDASGDDTNGTGNGEVYYDCLVREKSIDWRYTYGLISDSLSMLFCYQLH